MSHFVKVTTKLNFQEWNRHSFADIFFYNYQYYTPISVRIINRKTTWYEGPHRFFIRATHRRCEKSNVYHFFENQLKAPSPPHPACLHWTCQKYLALACGMYISCRPYLRAKWHQQCIHTITTALLIWLKSWFVNKMVYIRHRHVFILGVGYKTTINSRVYPGIPFSSNQNLYNFIR